ncbi:polysaccharide pyruvyl transferase family protein [Priestia megaterium]|uniref:polysaccharide pyruvyl transferase family protein n=1 Tax=Priestia megaterium TaxID=1404 RepID=UPI00406BA619
MHRIGIFGSVGYNIGDEAIAVSAAHALLELDSELDIYISTLKKDVIEGKYVGLKEFYLNRSNLSGWKKLFDHIKSLDVIVLGGGTMVQDKLGISLLRGMIPYMYQITMIAKLLRKPVLTLPIGIDKLNTNMGKRMAKKLLKNIDSLVVRDENSSKYANVYSNNVKAYVSADPAFFLNHAPQKINTEKYVTVSLVNENLDKKAFMPAIKDTIQWLIDNTEYSIYLVPMDRREEEELELFRLLLKELDSEKIHIVDPSLNVYDISEILRNSELLIGMRLHAMILSLGFTNLIGISRTTKTENLLEEFNLPYFDINRGNIGSGELIALVEKCITGERNFDSRNVAAKLEYKSELYYSSIKRLRAI